MDELSRAYARGHQELTGITPKEHAAFLRRCGVDGEAIAWLCGMAPSSASRLHNPETYRKHLAYNAAWKRERRRKEKQMNIDAEKLLLQLGRIADALETIQTSLSLLVIKTK